MNQNSIDQEINIPKNMVKGIIWSFGSRITQTIFYISKLIIVARILYPKDLGLFGIALLVIGILESFFQMGFNQVLIHKKDEIKDYIDSAWTLSIIRGLILFIILFFTAPFFAIIFNEAKSLIIIQIMGLTILFDAFKNISVVYFHKELNFKIQFIYFLSGILADFCITVVLIIIFANIWALILGMVIGKLVFMIISYLIAPYTPHFDYNLKKGKELFEFTKWVMMSNILIFLLIHGDDLIVSLILGTTALGFYQIAYNISSVPATEITSVFSNMSFPLYSKLQDESSKLNSAFLKTHLLTNFITVPIVGIIFFLSPDIINILLGNKWMPIVPVVQILIIWAFFRSIGRGLSTLFAAVGKPKINTLSQILQTIVLFTLIYPLTINWGIIGAAWAVLVSALTIFYVRIMFFIKMTGTKFWDFSKPILIQILFTTISMIPIFLLKIIFKDSANFIILILKVGCFITSFLLLNFIISRFFNYRIFEIIKEMINSLKK